MADLPDQATVNPLRLLPRVSPLGILEPGDNDAASPRVYPKTVRILSLLVLGIFLTVVVVTTSLSLGTYCLTTDAGSRFAVTSKKGPRP